MSRQPSPRALALAAAIQAERTARAEAAHLNLTEVDGVTCVLAKDLLLTDAVLNASDKVIGRVGRHVAPARKGQVVIHWENSTKMEAGELQILRVRRGCTCVRIDELVVGDVVHQFGDKVVESITVDSKWRNPALPDCRQVNVSFVGGGRFNAILGADGRSLETIRIRTRGAL